MSATEPKTTSLLPNFALCSKALIYLLLLAIFPHICQQRATSEQSAHLPPQKKKTKQNINLHSTVLSQSLPLLERQKSPEKETFLHSSLQTPHTVHSNTEVFNFHFLATHSQLIGLQFTCRLDTCFACTYQVLEYFATPNQSEYSAYFTVQKHIVNTAILLLIMQYWPSVEKLWYLSLHLKYTNSVEVSNEEQTAKSAGQGKTKHSRVSAQKLFP